MLKRTISSIAVAAMLVSVSGVISNVEAGAYAPAPAPKGTQLGFVKVDPYGNAPLSALIDLGSKKIKDVTVTVKGKPKGGIDISYPVGTEAIYTHDGIPVVGLYENYRNKVIVTFTDKKTGKKVESTYSILTGNVSNGQIDNRNITAKNEIEVVKVNPRFKDKLFMTNGIDVLTDGTTLGWTGQLKKGASTLTSPIQSTGSIGFEGWPVLYITDTQGEYRWWLDGKALAKDAPNAETKGNLMGVRPTKDGTFTFVFGQMWGEFDLSGKILYKHRLPRGYIDASHDSIEMPNGNVLLRAAKANYLNNEGDVVNTVRDHILELSKTGRLIRVWDLNESLDPYRDVLLKGLDQGAVCLNVDDSQKGKTVDSYKIDAPYGDIAGIGTGRNWAHVNSVEYDPSDDSIIISPRHQATAVKLTGDNKVKWILAPRAGWKPELAKKLLTPIDKNGKKLKCDDNGVCENTDFDFSFTQHTAWLSPNGTLTVLDNGDGRNNTQPALPTDKYTRFVEYKIDDKNMTVQQLWEYGKDRGYEWYSPITSNVQLITDDGKPYMYGFGGSAGLFDFKNRTKGIHNIIDYKTKDVLVEIISHSNRIVNPFYRGILMDPKEWFAK